MMKIMIMTYEMLRFEKLQAEQLEECRMTASNRDLYNNAIFFVTLVFLYNNTARYNAVVLSETSWSQRPVADS